MDKLIWHLETYGNYLIFKLINFLFQDVTSVRASTPMYFLSKKITDLGIKVVLSGEGSDEIFGGYL
jgi:asparagine synthase (glutamine-hydrolysing)